MRCRRQVLFFGIVRSVGARAAHGARRAAPVARQRTAHDLRTADGARRTASARQRTARGARRTAGGSAGARRTARGARRAGARRTGS
jgi:hypothetical protein